jgi:hypothetical protein
MMIAEKYQAQNGKKIGPGPEKDRLWVKPKPGDKGEGIRNPAQVNQILRNDDRNRKQQTPAALPVWLTVLFDEAHFMRNPMAYWGMMAAAIGTHSQRTICCTGTPYNNNLQDLASLCAFVSPRRRNPYNNVEWWKKAYGMSKDYIPPQEEEKVLAALEKWREEFWLRRTADVLATALPEKTVFDHELKPSQAELNAYFPTEKALFDKLNSFVSMLGKPAAGTAPASFINQKKKLAAFQALMALMQTARMYMLHPVVANQGREITRLFAPSR